ncbi:MAG: tetratricopeptide repeat protein [bacterium]|nr:MAG: tetratricopeptide repeat protein [bacterium]
MKEIRKGKGTSLLPLSVALIAACLMLVAGACGEREQNPRYAAEKSLFNARKTRDRLLQGTVASEFIDQVVDNYRKIVQEHRSSMKQHEGLEEIVVTAQIELAELEFRAQRFTDARNDFEEAAELAQGIPRARANAIYSAAVIAELMEDTNTAIELYKRFYGDYLNRESLEGTAAMNTRYLITPLKLSELYLGSGSEAESNEWLTAGKAAYDYLIENASDTAIVKEMHFNLLTCQLQGKEWQQALETIRELRARYREPADRASLWYLEAKILLEGTNEPQKALERFLGLSEELPDSREASIALLSAGNIEFSRRHYAPAKQLYQRLIDRFPDRTAEVVEAEWQLALLAEAQDNWVDASLRYKSIYTKYSNTLQGLEAPLRIAENYKNKGETDAANAAFNQAIEHFNGIIESQVSQSVKILAEKHLVRAYTEQGKWTEAADRLLELPDRYPDYIRFRDNYLLAASIFEQELGNNERAAEILRICQTRYPGTELALEAERQYNRIKVK